jgi:hypothetical protein
MPGGSSPYSAVKIKKQRDSRFGREILLGDLAINHSPEGAIHNKGANIAITLPRVGYILVFLNI